MQSLKTPSFRLDEKKALVTGAGKGLGLGAAIALSEAGANVSAVSRTLSDLEILKTELNRRGLDCHIAVLDVLDSNAVLKFIREQDRPFEILLNSAGTNIPEEAIDVSEENYNRLMDLNVKAAFFLTVEIAKSLIACKLTGSLINLSSQMGHIGGLKRSVYCASKHAVEGFTKAMAWEWGQYGIRVNTICPTFIETPMTEGFLKEQGFKEKMISQIALNQIGTIEDIMGGVIFLASDASALVTGSSLMIDGGWTAR